MFKVDPSVSDGMINGFFCQIDDSCDLFSLLVPNKKNCIWVFFSFDNLWLLT